MPTSPAPTDTINDLRAVVRGPVITADDPGYDDARQVVPGGIDRRPLAIVRVADAADIAQVLRVARETGLPLAVRSGGHSGATASSTTGSSSTCATSTSSRSTSRAGPPGPARG